MSVLDSRRYGRRGSTNFTYEEFMKIKNTPPADMTPVTAESERIKAKLRELREREHAAAPK